MYTFQYLLSWGYRPLKHYVNCFAFNCLILRRVFVSAFNCLHFRFSSSFYFSTVYRLAWSWLASSIVYGIPFAHRPLLLLSSSPPPPPPPPLSLLKFNRYINTHAHAHAYARVSRHRDCNRQKNRSAVLHHSK